MLRHVKSLSFLWSGSLIGSGSTFLTFILLAKVLGPQDFGSFSSVLSLINLFTLAAVFGLSQLWLKLFGSFGWEAISWVKPSLRFSLMILFISSAVLTIWSFIGPHDANTKHLTLVMIVFLFSNVSLQFVISKFQLEEAYSKISLIQVIPNLLRLILVYTFSVYTTEKFTVIYVGYIYAFIAFFTIIFNSRQLFSLSNGHIDLKGHKRKKKLSNNSINFRNIYRETWPFALSTIFAFIYIQSDIILLKYISGDSEAGYYNVSFVIISALLMFPSIIFSKFLLPKYHRWAKLDKDKLFLVYKKSNIIMLFTGGLGLFVMFFIHKTLVIQFFGREYIDSLGSLKIMILTIPIYFLSYSVGATLITGEYMRVKVKVMGGVALLNILLNIIFIPSYGAQGAAFTTLISNAVLLFLYIYIAKKVVFKGY
nr:MAG: hypothetical protein COB45_01760 [Gammaproteobacteria bacterium]